MKQSMSSRTGEQRPGKYDPARIEPKWRNYWEQHGTFRTPNPGDPDFDPTKPKYYVLDMFPYPSGSGLHVGHPVGYCATDIVTRYKRMCGYNVLHPMGFDAFGLPAEQYAIEHNVHPAVTTQKNIERYREQLKMFGFSYDWSRELTTCDPKYYKFTQWIFLKLYGSWYDSECEWLDGDGKPSVGRARPLNELLNMFESGEWAVNAAYELVRNAEAAGRREWADLDESQRRQALDHHRLAFVGEIPVNWCPALGTVLSNEEVTNEGRSDRGDHPVFRRPLRQWMLRITKFADRLLADLDDLDWPQPIKLMQRNWIGRSTGAEVVFPLAHKWSIDGGQWRHADGAHASLDALRYDNFPDAIRVYTTRPDTLFGATYMVLAPEHELVEEITTSDRTSEMRAYVQAAGNRSELDRASDTKDKTGVFTGAYAINPANGENIPIWIADYVLMGYGTGAIMAVPGGDTRDFEFACKFELPIVAVVKPPTEWIEKCVADLTSGVDQAASEGFDEVIKTFPDLQSVIEATRTRSKDLAEKTRRVLRDEVGLEKLAAHYVQHPRAWRKPYVGEGMAVHSPGERDARAVGGVCSLDGLDTADAKAGIVDWLEQNGVGRAAVNYKLRDWIFSRQKYWGEPFPVLHGDDGSTIAVSEDELPVELPEMRDFKPTPAAENAETLPEPPLGRARDWVSVERDGRSYRRDLNTMPQWAGSCWYYLRYLDAGNTERFCNADAERYWMPVDLYVGGAEHAVLHLLYARFWHKVLYDLGYVSTPEPFAKLFNQGMIQGFAYRDKSGRLVPANKVEDRGGEKFVLKENGEAVSRIIAKMSKSLKNVVNPDAIVSRWGADTFRLYEMYMGPLDAAKPWNTRDVPGLHKLCQRVWRLVIDERTDELSTSLDDSEPDADTIRSLHKFLKRVTGDIEQLKFNTAIAAIFDFVNFLTPRASKPRSVIESLVCVLAPFTPHLSEELWSRLGHAGTIAYETWPAYDDNLARDEQVEVGVQVNGKLKTRLMVAADADDDTVQTLALEDKLVAESLEGKTVRKVIVVKGRLVNIVAN